MRTTKGTLAAILALAAMAVALTACGGATVADDVAVSTIASVTLASAQAAAIPRNTGEILTINVDLTDQGFSPDTIFMAQGQRVKLVVRNKGATEHHFHIIGLDPADMLWSVKGTEMEGVDLTEEEAHNHDHGELADFHVCTSAFGICPTGLSVHAHAAPGDLDIIMFTTTNQGNFEITDPLHQNLMGTAIVF